MVVCMHYCAAAVIEKHGAPTTCARRSPPGEHLTHARVLRGRLAQPLLGAGRHRDRGRRRRRRRSTPQELGHVGRRGRLATSGRASRSPPRARARCGSCRAGQRGLSTVGAVRRARPARQRLDAGHGRGRSQSPSADRLGADGGGFDVMMGVVLPWFTVLSAALLGRPDGSRASASAAAHAGQTQFEHLGQSLADLPTIRAYIARMRIETDQTRALARRHGRGASKAAAPTRCCACSRARPRPARPRSR